MTKQTNLKLFVQSLTDEERHSIIRSYEGFEEQGLTGDTPVRVHARKYMRKMNVELDYTTQFMQYLAMECYKYYYDIVYKEVK